MAQTMERPVKLEEGETSRGSILDRPLLGAITLNWEIAFYVGLVILAGVMRYWDLGTRALHHDESLHALYSWNLFVGKGYQHDPMMHGPFLFTSAALGYFLFGVSDYISRITPALFGTVLVVLPYFLRRQLGRTGAMLAAVMLAFSPSMLYYGRFIRHDIYIAVWSMLLAIALWRYMEERKNSYLYLAAATIGLSFTTKEDTFITLAIFGFFLLVMGVHRLGLLAERSVDLNKWPAGLVLAVFVGTFYLPPLSAGVTLIQERLKIPISGQTALAGVVISNEGLAAGVVVAVLLAVSAAIGYRFFGRLWLIAAGIFYGIYVLLFTTFFTNMPGFGTGMWGSLGYWLLQHGVKRGDQPPYYYLILLVIYEFLPVALGLVATVYYGAKVFATKSRGQTEQTTFLAGILGGLRRNAFNLFLIYWSFAAVVAYSIAGEKMPWMLVSIALPIILLAAKFLGEVADRIDWRALGNRTALYLALLIPAIVFGALSMFRVTGPVNQGAAIGPNIQGIGLLIVVALAVGLAVQAGFGLGLRRSLQVFGVVVIIALFSLTVRAGIALTYYHGDIPVEMLVYTQTSPEVPKIKAEIDQIALRSGQGKDLKITVDASSGFSWPWAWYLKDYKNVDYPVLSNISGPPIGSILLLHDNNVDKAKPFLNKYGQAEKYHHRWWFPEDYRGVTLDKFVSDVFNGTSWARWWQYWIYRTTGPLGSENGQLFVQKDLVGTTITRAPAQEPPREYVEKQLNIKSVLAFGQKGSAPGQLNEPKGVAVDQQGNIYVLDSGNRRIEKFDPSGKFLAQVGREGSGDGEFLPNTGGAWGIAIDAQGFVYVADTWNHRIQKFDSDLKFVARWGENMDTKGVAQGNGGKFYGPRGIAVDPAGNLLVTDTGNHRVQKFSPQGEFMGAFGGVGGREGQFLEPVGIGADKDGNIFVADTWNHRIQKFDKDFKFIAQIPVNGWESTGILNKPHLAVEPGGSIIVADPENHRLLRFSAGGTLLAVINKPGTDNSSFNMPIGVATDGLGNIYVADTGNNRIQKFAALK